jgi:hypothetical protein
MNTFPVYSTLFSTIYNEQEPVGHLGRGSHYSVLRFVEWLDVNCTPLSMPQIHDIAVVWDEDHDTRVIEAIEKIYMAGLLSPIQFVGERKGHLSVIVDAKYYFHDSGKTLKNYAQAVEDIAQSLDDPWSSEVGSFNPSPDSDEQCIIQGLINDRDYRVVTYLKNIDLLWSLGTKGFRTGM